MSARDDLAEITDLLDPRHCARRSGGSLMLSVREVATRMVAAGWRPPARTIETEEELEALPEGTVIRHAYGEVFEKSGDDWFSTSEYWPVHVQLPATVLWEPCDGDE